MGVLVTSRMMNCVSRSAKQGEIIRSHPFEWSESEEVLQAVSSKNQYRVWQINTVVMILYYAYMNVRFFLLLTRDELEMSEAVIPILLYAYYNFIPMVMVPVVIHRQYYPRFYSSVIRGFRRFEETYCKDLKSTPSEMRTCEFCCELALWEFPLNGFMFGAVGVLYRDSVISIYPALKYIADWAVPGGDEGSYLLEGMLVVFLTAIFHAYVMLNLIPLCSLLTIVFCHVIFLVMTTLNIMCGRNAPRNAAEQKMDLGVYRVLELILAAMTLISNFSVWLTQMVVIILGVMGAYCAIRIGGFVAIIAPFGGILLVFLLSVFSFVADLNLKSEGLLQHWRDSAHKGSGEFRKSLRSLRALRMCIGNFYFVDKILVITIVQIVLDNTVTALLAA